MSLQKQPPIVSKKIRQSAKGQPCTMLSPVCCGDSNKVALRHYNGLSGGQGWGRKADDIFAFYGCQSCEDWFALGHDTRELKDSYMLNAMIKTQRKLFDAGLLEVK